MMTDADKPQFVAALAELVALKPGAALTPEQFGAWWNAMRGSWTLEDFRNACHKLAQDCEFMPNPYHFAQLRKAGGETAGEAFARARQIVRRLYQREMASHQSGDPKLDAAIRACGGYEALAMCTTENIGFFERRFAEHYESITDAEAVRGALPNLTGGERLTGPKKPSFGNLLEKRA